MIPARAVVTAIAACLLMAPVPPLHAERADRNKPINIEADTLRYDDLRQVSVFTGNVVLTKGTILLRADRLEMRQDAEGFQYGQANGSPASFRQKRDGVEQFVEGYGQQIDYDGRTETVKFNNKALLRRLDRDRPADEIHGNVIVYDSRTEYFTVESGGVKSATPSNPGGRVRVVIQPKSGDTPDPPPPGQKPSRPAPIKPDERIGPPTGGSGR